MKLFAVADTYDALIVAIRERRIELGLSQLAVDHLAGMPEGYQAKLECRLTNPNARNARSIGVDTLPILMHALGLQLGIFADKRDAEPGKIDPSLGRASKAFAPKTTNFQTLPPIASLSKRGRAGARRRNEVTTPEQRQAQARAASAVRWAGHVKKAKPLTRRQAALRRRQSVSARNEPR